MSKYEAAVNLIRGLDVLRLKQEVGIELTREESNYINELHNRYGQGGKD